MHQKIIRQYVVLWSLFMAGGMFTSATYVTFLRENGLNLFEVNMMNVVFYVTIFAFEIPTGAFADIFGRKKSVIIACCLRALGSFIYGGSHTFWGFACAEATAAVGATFMNGAFQAWLVDSLKHHGHEGDLGRIFARANLYGQVVGSICCIMGAYIAVKHPSVPWYLGGAIEIVVAVLAYAVIKEEYFVHQEFSWKKGICQMRDIAVSSVRYGRENRAVRFILIVTSMQIFAVQAFNMYWQPFFGSRHIEKEHFGFIFSGMMACLALGAFLASRINSRNKEKKILILAQAVAGVLVMLALCLSNLALVLVAFLLHETARGFWNPMKDAYLHKHIPSHERATIASFCSVAPHVGGAVGLVVSGAVAESAGISAAWAVAASVLIIGALLVAKNGHASSDNAVKL